MPEYQDLHVDALLTNKAIVYKNQAFIGSVLCPEIPMERPSDLYTIFDKERFRLVDTARADKTDISLYEESYTTGTYTTKGNAIGKLVSRKQRQNADAILRRLVNGTDDLREKIELAREVRVKTLANTATSFDTGNTITLGSSAGTAPWDDYTNTDSDPERDISTGCEAIESKIGFEPNYLVLTYKSARRLAMHPKLRALIKNTDSALLNQRTGLPPTVFGLTPLIGRASAATTKKGQTVTLTKIWDDDVAIVAFVAPNALAEDPTWLCTFQWGGWEVEANYLPTKKADFISVEAPEWDEKLIANTAAYKISNILQ